MSRMRLRRWSPASALARRAARWPAASARRCDASQRGYRGTGMDAGLQPAPRRQPRSPRNAVPAPLPTRPTPAADGRPRSIKNVQGAERPRASASSPALMVVDDRLGRAAAGLHLLPRRRRTWRPTTLYTKVVARRMLQMTQHINADWKTHVAETGVTCYTCHRGQPVPANIWFTDRRAARGRGVIAGNQHGQNIAGAAVGLASLPYDPFTPFLRAGDEHPRRRRRRALPDRQPHVDQADRVDLRR